MKKLILIHFMATAVFGCGKPAHCEPGFDPGEQFRITTKGPAPGFGICEASLLKPGDSFVLTAALGRIEDVSGNGCYTYGASGEVPEFAKSIITHCRPAGDQLGLDCEGASSSGCAVEMLSGVGPSIERGVTLLEDGVFRLNWGGSCQIPEACYGSQVFSVRIERLDTRGDY